MTSDYAAIQVMALQLATKLKLKIHIGVTKNTTKSIIKYECTMDQELKTAH